MIEAELNSTIKRHKLPDSFLQVATRWYQPIAADIAAQIKSPTTPVFIGVQGCQGSGKSTCADFLKVIFEKQYKLTTAVLSIDDFYLTKNERAQLGVNVHPFFATRGVPGTHDIALANHTLDALFKLTRETSCAIPRFNKAVDDRLPEHEWDRISGPISIVILEGWCVGLTAQSSAALETPVNSLEREGDQTGSWRQYANAQLAAPYAELFARLDALLVLKAPSFSCVYNWRLLQEQKLIAALSEQKQTDTNQTMSAEQIRQFIAHYQRLTEHGFKTLPTHANWLLELSENHEITDMRKPTPFVLPSGEAP